MENSYNIITLKVVPGQLKIRDPWELEVVVLNTPESRQQGFQHVSPFDAGMPYLFQWENGNQRILHNSNVLFPVKALTVGPKNQVEQLINLKEGDPTNTLTRPCRFLLEIPETLFETVIVEPGDTLLGMPNPI